MDKIDVTLIFENTKDEIDKSINQLSKLECEDALDSYMQGVVGAMSFALIAAINGAPRDVVVTMCSDVNVQLNEYFTGQSMCLPVNQIAYRISKARSVFIERIIKIINKKNYTNSATGERYSGYDDVVVGIRNYNSQINNSDNGDRNVH